MPLHKNLLFQNPYIVGKPVRGDSFVGRREIIEQAENVIFSSTGTTSLTILGQRRIGKTSILHELERRAKSARFPVVYLDLFEFANRPMSDVLVRLTQFLSKRLHLDAKLSKLELDNEGRIFRKKVLTTALRKVPKKQRLVLMFDEFDVTTTTDNDSTKQNITSNNFFNFIRELMVEEESVFIVVALGRNLTDSKLLATFKGGETIHVSVMSSLETKKLLEAYPNTIRYTNEAIDHIYNLTRGHPYLTQLIGARAVDKFAGINLRSKSSVPLISKDEIDALVPLAIRTIDQQFAYVWDALPISDKILTSAIAEAIPTKTELENSISVENLITYLQKNPRFRTISTSLIQALNNLAKWQILEKVSERPLRYAFYIPMFHRWMKEYRKLSYIQSDLDKIDPRAERLYELAYFDYRAREPDSKDTIKKLRTALQINPDHLQARILLGQIYQELGDIDSSIIEFEEAYKRQKDDETTIRLARALTIRGKINSDIDDYLSALDLLPSYREAEEGAIPLLKKTLTYQIKEQDWVSAEDTAMNLLKFDTSNNAKWSDQLDHIKEQKELLLIKQKAEELREKGEFLESVKKYVVLIERNINLEATIQDLSKVVDDWKKKFSNKGDISNKKLKSAENVIGNWTKKTVRAIMSEVNACVSPSNTLWQVLSLMNKFQTNQLVVTEKGDISSKLLGLITIEDVLERISSSENGFEEMQQVIEEPRIMLDHKNLQDSRVLLADDSIYSALEYLRNKWQSPFDKSIELYPKALVVIDSSYKICGMVRYIDILKAIYYHKLLVPEIEVSTCMTPLNQVKLIKVEKLSTLAETLKARDIYWLLKSSGQEAIAITNFKNRFLRMVDYLEVSRKLQDLAENLDTPYPIEQNPDYVEMEALRSQQRIKDAVKHFLKPPYHFVLPVTRFFQLEGVLSYIDLFKAIK